MRMVANAEKDIAMMFGLELRLKRAMGFRDMNRQQADYMKLTIKPNERIFPLEIGLDALGYITFQVLLS